MTTASNTLQVTCDYWQ